MENEGKPHVSEVYSPPRITNIAENIGLKKGWALDLTEVDPEDGQPWDFSRPDKQLKAKRMLAEDKPFMVIICPMCGHFSRLREVFSYPKQPTEEVTAKIDDALKQLKFAVEVCLLQREAGRLFLFEHPASARSWYAQTMTFLASLEGVFKTSFDFCMVGMETQAKDGTTTAAKKRTSILTNSWAISSLLRGAQCRG